MIHRLRTLSCRKLPVILSTQKLTKISEISVEFQSRSLAHLMSKNHGIVVFVAIFCQNTGTQLLSGHSTEMGSG